MVSLSSIGLTRKLNNNFRRATDRVAEALERLSSGNRLNGVEDGAVDYAKFRGLQAQSRGLSQVLGNVGDVRGLTEKADSTLSAMMQMAYDLRELAQRATNEGLTTEEREALQTEAQSIISDFSDYANDTSYNTFKLLDGSFGTKSVQNGLEATSNFEFGIGDARTITLGKIATVSGSQNDLLTTTYIGDGTSYARINNVYIPAGSDDGVSSSAANSSALARVNAINSVSNETGVYAETLGTIETLYFSDSGSTFNDTLAATDFKINGVSITGAGVDTVTELITAINTQSDSTGVIASADANGNIQLEAVDGRNIQIQISNSSGNGFYDAVNLSQNADLLGNGWSTYSTGIDWTNVGAIRIWSSESIRIETNSAKALGFSAGTYNLSGGTSLQALNLESTSNAEQAIKTLDTTIEQISSLRANIGAIHSRLDNSASKLIQDIDVTDQAAQTIGGADFALETAKLVYNQLVQDSALASMIQANVSRVTVAKLLGDL